MIDPKSKSKDRYEGMEWWTREASIRMKAMGEVIDTNELSIRRFDRYKEATDLNYWSIRTSGTRSIRKLVSEEQSEMTYDGYELYDLCIFKHLTSTNFSLAYLDLTVKLHVWLPFKARRCNCNLLNVTRFFNMDRSSKLEWHCLDGQRWPSLLSNLEVLFLYYLLTL